MDRNNNAYNLEFSQPDASQPKTTWNALIDWCLCFAISVLPIVLLAFFVVKNSSPWEYIWNSSDMLFVCVSLALSALFEANLHKGQKWELMKNLLLLDIIGSSFLYMIAECSLAHGFPMNIPIARTTKFVVLFTLMIGIISFISSRREINK